MKYNFKVDPKVLYLFIDNMDENKYNSYLNEFKEFRFKYNSQLEETKSRLFEVICNESDNLQMLIIGVKDNGKEEVIAYYFIGQEPVGCVSSEKEEYNEAINCLNDILENYRID